MYDIANVCDQSSHSNVSVLVGTHDGKVLVPVYDWATKLAEYFHTVKNILQYQHFKMSSSEPGVVNCFKELSDEPTKIRILRVDPKEIKEDLPKILEPKGFSLERSKYLNEEIRPFCFPGKEDSGAPLPPLDV